ncbi:VRR-NUC domain-containing protein [Anaerotruncus massiliensis (ex Liu et al. 2021)]|uniref:VRR-NUC domain-containing protein n=1 Tax=Anaerotruncus massiliensis (ex Liu et al. 2021) TaxID=2321404 RepID=UPI003AB3F90B
MKESAIEARLVKMVRERGGLCYKFVSPSNPGVPDRIVITPDGRSIYVELKTEIGRLATIQRWQLDEMRKRGADVRVLKGLEEVKAFVREVMPDEVSTA